MQTVRRQWRRYRTYRRVLRLWEQYRAVAHWDSESTQRDLGDAATKLDLFLSEFAREIEQQQQQLLHIQQQRGHGNGNQQYGSGSGSGNRNSSSNVELDDDEVDDESDSNAFGSGNNYSDGGSGGSPPPSSRGKHYNSNRTDNTNNGSNGNNCDGGAETTTTTGFDSSSTATDDSVFFSRTRHVLAQRFAAESGDIDRLFGDCTQILMNLLEWVEFASTSPAENGTNDHGNGNKRGRTIASSSAAPAAGADADQAARAAGELINKALNVAELILRDPKYQDVVRQTPDLLKRIVSLMDSMNTVENKRKILQVISVLGQSEENTVEIGRVDGFRKMLRMLLSGDRDLNGEVVRTLNHFVSAAQSTADPVGVLHALAEGPALQSAVHALAESSTPANLSKQSGSFGELFSAARSVGSMAVSSLATEFSRAFGMSDSETSEDDSARRQGHSQLDDRGVADTVEKYMSALYQTAVQTSAEYSADGKAESHKTRAFVPPGVFIDTILASKLDQNGAFQAPDAASQHTDGSNIASDSVRSIGTDVVAEFLRVQGALSALANAFKEAAWAEQMDVFELISRLLFNNRRSQDEFRKLDGYSRFLPEFVQNLSFMLVDFESFPESQVSDDPALAAQRSQQALLIDDVFSLFFVVCLDGNPRHEVGNLDVLELLVGVLIQPRMHPLVVAACIRCLTDLLVVNPSNIGAFWHVGSIDSCINYVAGVNTISAGDDEESTSSCEDRQPLFALQSRLRVVKRVAEEVCVLAAVLSSSSCHAQTHIVQCFVSALEFKLGETITWLDFDEDLNSLNYAEHVARAVITLRALIVVCEDYVCESDEACFSGGLVNALHFSLRVLNRLCTSLDRARRRQAVAYRFAPHVLLCVHLATLCLRHLPREARGTPIPSFLDVANTIARAIEALDLSLEVPSFRSTDGEVDLDKDVPNYRRQPTEPVDLAEDRIYQFAAGALRHSKFEEFGEDAQANLDLVQALEFSLFALKECATSEAIACAADLSSSPAVRTFEVLARLAQSEQISDQTMEQLCYCLVEFVQGVSSKNRFSWTKSLLLSSKPRSNDTAFSLGECLVRMTSKVSLFEAAFIALGEFATDCTPVKTWLSQGEVFKQLTSNLHSALEAGSIVDADIFDLVTEMCVHCGSIGAGSFPSLTSFRHRSGTNNVFARKLAHSTHNGHVVERMRACYSPQFAFRELPPLSELAASVLSSKRSAERPSRMPPAEGVDSAGVSKPGLRKNFSSSALSSLRSHRRTRSDVTEVRSQPLVPDVVVQGHLEPASVASWSVHRDVARMKLHSQHSTSLVNDTRPTGGSRSNPSTLRFSSLGTDVFESGNSSGNELPKTNIAVVNTTTQWADFSKPAGSTAAQSNPSTEDLFFPSFAKFEPHPAGVSDRDIPAFADAPSRRFASARLAKRLLSVDLLDRADSPQEGSSDADDHLFMMVRQILSAGDDFLFVGFTVGSESAASLLLEALRGACSLVFLEHGDIETHAALHAFDVLSGLLRSSEANTRMLAGSGGVKLLLHEFTQAPSYADSLITDVALLCVESMLRIESTEADLSMLVSLATSRSQSLLNSQILQLMSRLCGSGRCPPNYFELSGVTGLQITIPTVSKSGSKKQQQFPPFATGYTLRFWVRVNRCTNGEVGLVSLYDIAGNDVLELFLRVETSGADIESSSDLDTRPLRWIVCASVTQRSLDATAKDGQENAQTVMFDDCVFYPRSCAEWGAHDRDSTDWHLLIFSHGPNGVFVSLNGRISEAKDGLTYPTAALGRGNRISGVRIGQRHVTRSFRERWAKSLVDHALSNGEASTSELSDDASSLSKSNGKRDSFCAPVKVVSILRDSADVSESAEYTPENTSTSHAGFEGAFIVERARALKLVGLYGSFAGSVSAVHLHEGALSAQQCRRLWAVGPSCASDAGSVPFVPVVPTSAKLKRASHTCNTQCNAIRNVLSDTKLRTHCWPLQPSADSSIPHIDWVCICPEELLTDAITMPGKKSTRMKHSEPFWFHIGSAVDVTLEHKLVSSRSTQSLGQFASFESRIVCANSFSRLCARRSDVIFDILVAAEHGEFDVSGCIAEAIRFVCTSVALDSELLNQFVSQKRGYSRLWNCLTGILVKGDNDMVATVVNSFTVLCEFLCAFATRAGSISSKSVVLLNDAPSILDVSFEGSFCCTVGPGAASQLFELLCDFAPLASSAITLRSQPRLPNLFELLFDGVLKSTAEVSIDFWFFQYFSIRSFDSLVRKRLKQPKDKEKSRLPSVAADVLFTDPLSVLALAIARAHLAAGQTKVSRVASEWTLPMFATLHRFISSLTTVDELVSVLNVVLAFTRANDPALCRTLESPFGKVDRWLRSISLCLASCDLLEVFVRSVQQHSLCHSDMHAKQMLPSMLPHVLSFVGSPFSLAIKVSSESQGNTVSLCDDRLRVAAIRLLAIILDCSPRQMQREFCSQPQKVSDKPSPISGGFNLLERAVVAPLLSQARALRTKTLGLLRQSTLPKTDASSPSDSSSNHDHFAATESESWAPLVAFPGWIEPDEVEFRSGSHIFVPRVSKWTVTALIELGQGFPKRDDRVGSESLFMMPRDSESVGQTKPARFSFREWWAARGTQPDAEGDGESKKPPVPKHENIQTSAGDPASMSEPSERLRLLAYPTVVRVALSFFAAAEHVATQASIFDLACRSKIQGTTLPTESTEHQRLIAGLHGVGVFGLQRIWELLGGSKDTSTAEISAENVEALLNAGVIEWLRDFADISSACSPPLLCRCGRSSDTCFASVFDSFSSLARVHTGSDLIALVDSADKPEKEIDDGLLSNPKVRKSTGLDPFVSSGSLTPGATSLILAGALRGFDGEASPCSVLNSPPWAAPFAAVLRQLLLFDCLSHKPSQNVSTRMLRELNDHGFALICVTSLLDALEANPSLPSIRDPGSFTGATVAVGQISEITRQKQTRARRLRKKQARHDTEVDGQASTPLPDVNDGIVAEFAACSFDWSWALNAPFALLRGANAEAAAANLNTMWRFCEEIEIVQALASRSSSLHSTAARGGFHSQKLFMDERDPAASKVVKVPSDGGHPEDNDQVIGALATEHANSVTLPPRAAYFFPSGWVLLRVIDCINNLVLCNATTHTNAFRTAMKKSGMLELRDSCVLLMLRGLVADAENIPVSESSRKRSTNIAHTFTPRHSKSDSARSPAYVTPRSWGSLTQRAADVSSQTTSLFAYGIPTDSSDGPLSLAATASHSADHVLHAYSNTTVALAAALLDSRSARLQFLSTFPFHSVADHKQFREGGGTMLLLRAFISACHSILVCQNRTAPSASRDEESKSQTSRSSSRFSRHRSKSKSKRSRAHTAPTEPKRASSDAEIMSPIDDSSLDGDAPSIAGTATISSDEVSDDPVHSDDELRQGKKLGSIGRAPSASKRFLRSHASALTSLAQSIYEVLTDILATVEDNRKAMVSILEDGTELKSQDGCADALIDAFFVMRRLPGLAIDLSGTRVVTRTTSSGYASPRWSRSRAHHSGDSWDDTLGSDADVDFSGTDELDLDFDPSDSADATIESFVDFYVSSSVSELQRSVVEARLQRYLLSSSSYKAQRAQLKSLQQQNIKRERARKDRLAKLHAGNAIRGLSDHFRTVQVPQMRSRTEVRVAELWAHESTKSLFRKTSASSVSPADFSVRSRSSSNVSVGNQLFCSASATPSESE